MIKWKITWWNYGMLKEVIVETDFYNLAGAAAGAGVDMYAILKVERVPQ